MAAVPADSQAVPGQGAPQQRLEGPPRPPRPRRWWRAAGWLAGGACLVLAALIAREYMVGHARPGGGRQAVAVGQVGDQPAPGEDAGGAATDPAGMAGSPLAGTGLSRLPAAPPDALAPPDAALLHAFRQTLPNSAGAQDLVAYSAPGPLERAERFYLERLAAAGYKLAGRKQAPDGRLRLTFAGPAEHCSVSIRNTDIGSVRIELVIFRGGTPPAR